MSLREGAQKSSTIFPEPDACGFLSGLTPFITQIASKTSFTPVGGFFIDLTSVMSDGLRVSRAVRAASRAGTASAKSLSQSSLIA